MKEVMEKLMEKKSGKSADKKKAKMDSIKKMMEHASKMMKDDMADMKKVTVMANDEEGLEEGLETAKEILGSKSKKNNPDEDDEY